MVGYRAGLGGAEVLTVLLLPVILCCLFTSAHCQYRPHQQLSVLTLATSFWLCTLERVYNHGVLCASKIVLKFEFKTQNMSSPPARQSFGMARGCEWP